MASPNQILGRVEIYTNGTRLDSMPGAKINPGGFNRTPVVGDGGVLGFTSTPVAPLIECEVVLKRGQRLRDKDFEDATVIAVGDSGQRWVVDGAFLTEPPAVTGGDNGGRVPLKISGISCSER